MRGEWGDRREGRKTPAAAEMKTWRSLGQAFPWGGDSHMKRTGILVGKFELDP